MKDDGDDRTGNLFGEDPSPPYQRHSDTSRAAAVAIEPNAGTLRAAVLTEIKRRAGYGATDEELQTSLRMQGSTQRPRRVELQEAGLIVDSTERRQTRSGRRAVVWVAAQHAAKHS